MKWQKNALNALHGALVDFETDLEWQQMMVQAYHHNRWFEEAQVTQSLNQWRSSLADEASSAWLSQYQWPENSHNQRLGIIMAGNIPLVGLHDIVVGVLSGYKVLAKMSSDDSILPKYLLRRAGALDPIWTEQVEFMDQLKQLDVAIATGSNNSARYFSAFFQKIPHVIRNNRNSLAVLSGEETTEDWIALGRDVFDYFGLGCRNVTHLLVPAGYDFTPMLQCWDQHYDHIQHHNKYANNYQYHRALLLMNLDPHIDTGYVIAKEKSELYAPVGMLNYSFYQNLEEAQARIAQWENDLQCVVTGIKALNGLPFGSSQTTALGDYADGVDTTAWLLEQSANR